GWLPRKIIEFGLAPNEQSRRQQAIAWQSVECTQHWRTSGRKNREEGAAESGLFVDQKRKKKKGGGSTGFLRDVQRISTTGSDCSTGWSMIALNPSSSSCCCAFDR